MLQALDKMHAERIGHGYSVVGDEDLYKRCVKDRVHFECCPSSSYVAGLVPLTQTKHPIQRLGYVSGWVFPLLPCQAVLPDIKYLDYKFLLNAGAHNEEVLSKSG